MSQGHSIMKFENSSIIASSEAMEVTSNISMNTAGEQSVQNTGEDNQYQTNSTQGGGSQNGSSQKVFVQNRKSYQVVSSTSTKMKSVTTKQSPNQVVKVKADLVSKRSDSNFKTPD